jgi:hypothetical protein
MTVEANWVELMVMRHFASRRYDQALAAYRDRTHGEPIKLPVFRSLSDP